MLIIEGADRLGKTTLAKKVADHVKKISGFDVPVCHMGIRPANFHYYWGYVNRIQRWTVWDRFHYGAKMYEKVLSHTMLDLIRGRIRAMGGFTVILYADRESYREELSQNPDDKFPIDKLLSVNDGYKDLVFREKPFDLGDVWDSSERYPDDAFVMHVAERYACVQEILQSQMKDKTAHDLSF